MKRILSLFMCLMLCVSILPAPAMAARDTSFEETLAVDLKELGLFKGVTDTNFALGRAPTRTEALIMLIRVLGQEEEALNGTWSHPFTDVAAWADNYVGYAYETGLTTGVDATRFGLGNATAQMYLTFVLRALGYSDQGGLDFTYSDPYTLAGQVGILPDGVDLNNFWRADVVLVSYAALPVCLKDSDQTLAEKLIQDGAFTQAQYDACYAPDALENQGSFVPSTFSVHFIDVGQADAALVECDGEYMLIDGGNKADSSRIYSVLQSAGVDRLSIVVGTHPHEDHIGGLPGAYSYTSADLTLCPVTSYNSDAFRDFASYAARKGGGITVPSVGDTYSLGSADVTILGVNGADDPNNTSIVLKIQYGQTSFLFTGDAEREAEQVILASGMDLSATVLKVGHHGSSTSTTYPFLREVMPDYAVISVGDGNSYEHPDGDTLSRLRDAGAKVFRTDLQGDVYAVSDGWTVTFSTDRYASQTDILTPPVSNSGNGNGNGNGNGSGNGSGNAGQTDPVGMTYILNTNSKKFHEPDCGSAAKISAANKGTFTGTRDQLIAMGYSPCGNCDPRK